MSCENYQRRVDRVHAQKSLLGFLYYCWWYPEPLKIGKHTREICDRLTKAVDDYLDGKSTYLLIQVPYRHGKALALETPIPTPNGWATMGSLSVGDEVIGTNGQPVRVIAKTPVQKARPVYAVEVNGNETIYADENHIWSAKLDRRQKAPKLYDTKTIAKPRGHSCQVEMAAPIKGAESQLTIPPYVLGMWLGDGSNACGRITTGQQDIDLIRGYIQATGERLCPVQSCGSSYTVKGLGARLKDLDLIHNKRIPIEYLRATKAERMELLRGLMDSDGEVGGTKPRPGRNLSMTGGQCTYTGTHKPLVDGVLELVRTLGVKASMTTSRANLKGVDCGPMYKVSFYLEGCAKLPRKANRTRNATRFKSHAIKAKYSGKADVACIQVDSDDGLFLCGRSFIPTHNSDIVSRAFPAFFLGRCMERQPNLISSAYGGGLAEGFSKDCKRIIKSDAYREVFPEIEIAHGSDNISEWAVEGSVGRCNFVGLGGSAVGKGAHFLGIDDYCKSRAEARSQTIRDKVWDAFRIDLMSRLAPAHIVCITATPWHVDDVAGRIQDEMGDDPDFPSFERMRFPARTETGFLFEELYSPEWYRTQYALQGKLAGANLDCNPQQEGGNRFDTTKIVVHNSLDDFPQARYVRCWDLASSSKQRSGDDPDYTAGALGCTVKEDGVYSLWIKDIVALREEKPKRDKAILRCVEGDGGNVTVCVEAFGAYKDTYTDLRETLRGKRTIKKLNAPGDKEVKAAPLEPIFEAGNVHILRSDWNTLFLDHFNAFPDGKHDDIVDAVAMIYHATAKGGSTMIF